MPQLHRKLRICLRLKQKYSSPNIGDAGAYENVSEYVRDLIRRDKERVESERLALLKGRVGRCFFRARKRISAA